MNTKIKLKTWVKVTLAVVIYLSLLIPILGIRKDVDKASNDNCIIYEKHVVCIYE